MAFLTPHLLVRSCVRMQSTTYKIGCASGFWGDSAVSTPQLLHGTPHVDVIAYDFLSEITMSLLAAAKARDEKMGYCPDFLLYHMAPNIEMIKSKGVKIVANAGGINPVACGAALQKLAESKGVKGLNIAVVDGDDLTNQIASFKAAGVTEMDSGIQFPSKIASINAYFGAVPIKLALDAGADVVITGRCVDSALALGPLMHKYSLSDSSFDQLAVGSTAGHLIECGAQATGGIFTDWSQSNDWENIGFPIAEFDGNPNSFAITKPAGTGGMVTRGTVSEQLVYEIGDPAAYQLPDVTCDFTNVVLSQEYTDRVRVEGSAGLAPSDKMKVSATYLDGYRCIAVIPIVGPRAAEKAEKTAAAVLARCRQIFKAAKFEDFSKTEISIIGAEKRYAGVPVSDMKHDAREVVLWCGVHHKQKQALEVFARELAPGGTGMAPGLVNIVGGRPKVSPVLRLFSFLVPKSSVKAEISMNGQHLETYRITSESAANASASVKPQSIPSSKQPSNPELKTGSCSHRLEDLAFLRSGDKGNNCNIGVVCRDPAVYPYLEKYLTEQVVAEYFKEFFETATTPSSVKRYNLPGIQGFNFVLSHVLGGGGVASLRFDPQGKGFAQMMCDLEIGNMPALDDIVINK